MQTKKHACPVATRKKLADHHQEYLIPDIYSLLYSLSKTPTAVAEDNARPCLV